MNRAMRWGQGLLLGAAMMGLAQRSAAQEPDPRVIVDQAAKAYAALKSFRADFRQVIADSMIGTYESQGTLTQAGPAQLTMRFSDPKDDAIVMDGEHLWVYTPSTTPGQVIRLKVPSDPTYGPNVLAWILTRPADRYQSRYLRSDAVAGRGVHVIALVPLDKSLPFTEATVWLDQYDALPRRLEFRERGGTRRTLVFSAVEVNRRIPANQFTFSVPSG
ncbi:MAG: outer membrane lipoprotein carrier protein LolA, partial [Gemmatimonadales bacterium]